jgi:hypothetical protein
VRSSFEGRTFFDCTRGKKGAYSKKISSALKKVLWNQGNIVPLPNDEKNLVDNHNVNLAGWDIGST